MCYSFMKTSNLVIRARISVGRLLHDWESKLPSFHSYATNFFRGNDILLHTTFNMGKVPMKFNMSPCTLRDEAGKHTITVKTIRHKGTLFTVVLH